MKQHKLQSCINATIHYKKQQQKANKWLQVKQNMGKAMGRQTY
jgi:hypothetical protein